MLIYFHEIALENTTLLLLQSRRRLRSEDSRTTARQFQCGGCHHGAIQQQQQDNGCVCCMQCVLSGALFKVLSGTELGTNFVNVLLMNEYDVINESCVRLFGN